MEHIENLVAFFKVLADNSRLMILDFLKEDEKSVKEIEEALGKSHATIAQHLKTLVNSKFITFKKKNQGKRSIKLYTIKYPQIFKLLSLSNVFISEINKEDIEDKMRDLAKKEKLDILKI